MIETPFDLVWVVMGNQFAEDHRLEPQTYFPVEHQLSIQYSGVWGHLVFEDYF